MVNNPFEQIDNRLKSIEDQLVKLTSNSVPELEKKYYRISEASQKLNVAPITLYRGVEKGTIPFKKVGSRILIPGSFVDR